MLVELIDELMNGFLDWSLLSSRLMKDRSEFITLGKGASCSFGSFLEFLLMIGNSYV